MASKTPRTKTTDEDTTPTAAELNEDLTGVPSHLVPVNDDPYVVVPDPEGREGQDQLVPNAQINEKSADFEILPEDFEVPANGGRRLKYDGAVIAAFQNPGRVIGLLERSGHSVTAVAQTIRKNYGDREQNGLRLEVNVVRASDSGENGVYLTARPIPPQG